MSAIPASYKAAVYEKYGPCDEVLTIATVPTGTLAAASVRIKVHSASINPIDYLVVEMYGAYLTGGSPSAEKPYKIGFDAAGVVVEVGAEVTDFKVGDEIYTRAEIPNFGTVAEYIDVEAKFVAPKPKNVDFDQAASVPLVALTSYQGLFQHADVKAGQRVLVLGGSSSTGIFGVQFAKAVGAHVIATTSAKNAELVKSLGADQVIDYTTQKWVDVLEAHSIDVIYDCGMEPASWNKEAQVVLKKNTGRYVSLLQIPEPIESPIGASQVYMFCKSSGDDLQKIGALIESGKAKTIIDSVVPFEKLVDGINRVKSRRAVGKVVVKIL